MKWIKASFSRYFHLPSKNAVFIFSILCGTIVLFIAYKYEWPFAFAIPLVVIITASMYLIPKWGRTIFALLSLISLPVGTIVSFLLLAIIFFLVITPIGLFRKRQFISGWNESSQIEKTKLYE